MGQSDHGASHGYQKNGRAIMVISHCIGLVLKILAHIEAIVTECSHYGGFHIAEWIYVGVRDSLFFFCNIFNSFMIIFFLERPLYMCVNMFKVVD